MLDSSQRYNSRHWRQWGGGAEKRPLRYLGVKSTANRRERECRAGDKRKKTNLHTAVALRGRAGKNRSSGRVATTYR